MPPAIPDKIPCDTEQQLQREINDLKDAIDREETEESWEQILRALARFKAIVRGGAYRHDSFVQSLKPVCRFIVPPMLSERGRLLAVAIDLVSTLATALGKRFDPLMQPFALAILKLCQRPNKVVLNRAQGCLITVIKQTSLPSIIPFLRESVKDKSAVLRVVASEAVYLCMTNIDTDKLAGRVADLEAIIKSTGRDANPEVRKQARAILTEFREKFPDRISAFINPLTPITRKYLEVQKFADFPSAGSGESLATKLLAGPQSRPKTISQRTHTPEPQPARPASAMRATSRVFPPIAHPTSSAMEPPPRPHSSTSMRPRLVAASNGNLNSRPLSAHVSGHVESSSQGQMDRPRSVLDEWNQRLELQRKQSRDNIHGPTAVNAVAFPSSATPLEQVTSQFSNPYGEQRPNYRERQRSTSVTNGHKDVHRATSIIQSTNDGTVHGVERQGPGPDHQPRPPSAASDRPAFSRPKSVLSMRSNGPLHPSGRPISTTSDTLEQFRSAGVLSDSDAARPKSPLGPQRPAMSIPDRPPPMKPPTPRAGVERPAVVYLPTSNSDVAPRPRAQKTWSLRHQLELLNKRKKQEDAKSEDVKISSPSDAEGPLLSDPPNVTPVSSDSVSVNIALGDAPNVAYTEEPEVNRDLAKSATTAGQEPVLVHVPEKPQTREVIVPVQTVIFPTTVAEPDAAPSPIVQAQPTPVETARNDTRQIVSSTVPPIMVANAKPGISSRPRTISASKMPVRAPSRSTTPQPVGFVPKRTVKNSITQPTKSQAARAQAVMNEKAAAAVKSTASTSEQSSHASTKQKGPLTKQTLASSTGSFRPTSKTIPPATTVAVASGRSREGPRKPPVPTVSSLVKTHAARREAGLATVKVRLGGAPPPSGARSTTGSRTRPQAVVSSKKVIRSVDANASRNADLVHATSKQTYMTASTPAAPSDMPAAGTELAPNYGDKPDSLPKEQGTGAKTVERKSNPSQTFEATMPLPSSSFAIGDEMVGITFKQPGETCTIPAKGGNESGGRLLKELHVS